MNLSEKRCMAIFSLTFFLIFLVCHESSAEPYQHPATGFVFPDHFAEMDKGKVTDYEKDHPGLGVSASYDAPGITLTIYLYDMGMKSISSDLNSAVFTEHFEQVVGEVIQAENRGVYSSVMRLSEAEVFLSSTQTGPRALAASFSYVQNGRERLSKLYLTGYKDHFLKVRFTYDKIVQIKGEKTLKQFLDELSMIIQDSQTGQK